MHLWSITDPEPSWLTRPLNGHPVALSFDGAVLDEPPPDAPVVLQPSGRDWLLISKGDAAVSLNGRSLGLGIARLRDKDEILLPSGHRFYFSTESKSEKLPFPGLPDGQPCFCARCQDELKTGQPSVRCGGCGVFAHEECWHYAPTCPACPQETTGDADYNFNPEAL